MAMLGEKERRKIRRKRGSRKTGEKERVGGKEKEERKISWVKKRKGNRTQRGGGVQKEE